MDDSTATADTAQRSDPPGTTEQASGTTLAAGRRGSRIDGDNRRQLAEHVSQRYTEGESIRAIAADVGRSYGFVHRLLTEADTPLRGRGGATRRSAS